AIRFGFALLFRGTTRLLWGGGDAGYFFWLEALGAVFFWEVPSTLFSPGRRGGFAFLDDPFSAEW
ncbi:hypothetical protein OAU96_02175, partial [Planctomycetota bacterium]|nr:hypothetical protein [Planctomycetota bacterium]